MPKTIDYTGRTYGRLTVLHFIEARVDANGFRRRFYLLRCTCGVEKEMPVTSFGAGQVASCGCVRREMTPARSTTHGHSAGSRRRTRTPEYRAWCAMKARCHNARNPSFPDYGGRGIAVCEEWLSSFEDFFAHVGPRPSDAHSIDRIANDRGYEPGNVRWATKSEQAFNRRPKRVA